VGKVNLVGAIRGQNLKSPEVFKSVWKSNEKIMEKHEVLSKIDFDF